MIELHGSARFVSCLSCEARFDADPMVEQFLAENAVPPCPACNGLLKHATISFGQALKPEILEEAIQLSRDADCFLAMGSSLVVEPAVSLPRLAKQEGGRLIIINRDPTPVDRLADAVIHASIGESLGKSTAVGATMRDVGCRESRHRPGLYAGRAFGGAFDRCPADCHSLHAYDQWMSPMVNTHTSYHVQSDN